MLINKTIFKQGLSILGDFVLKRSTMPILEQIMFCLEGGWLVMKATDISTTAIFKMEVSNMELLPNGNLLAASYKTLSALVNTINADSIELSFDLKDYKVVITGDNCKSKINGMSGEEFPLLPPPEGGEVLLPQGIRTSLRQVLFAAGKDTAREVLCTVNFEFTKDTLKLTTADGIILAQKAIHGDNFPEHSIPVQSKLIESLLGIQGDATMIFGEESTSFRIVNSNWDLTIIALNVYGNYPDVESLFPQSFITQVVISKSDLLAALRTVVAVVKKAPYPVFTFKEKGITLKAASEEMGDVVVAITADIVGENNRVKLNALNLQKAVGACEDELISLAIAGKKLPVLITDNKGFLFLAMPFLLEEEEEKES